MNTRKTVLGRMGLSALVASGTAVALAAVLGPRGGQAADIDLFTSSDGEAYVPNLYVIVDNSANWSATISGTTKKKMEHQALHSIFMDTSIAGDGSDSDPYQLRVGFGLFSDSNDPKGGKVWEHVKELSYSYQDNEIDPMLYDADGNMNLPKANNAPYALSFNEAHAYYAGAQPVSGTKDGDHDTEAIASDGTYISPAAGNCGKNYVVLIGNGEPDSGEDNDAEDKLTAHGGRLDDDPIDIDPDNFESNWSDEYARFMAKSEVVPDSIRDGHEQNVRTYVIDVYDPDQTKTRKFKSARAWLKSIASQGRGLYFPAHSTSDIKSALQKILDEVFAVNDVFAASTLPVSVNVRGTNLNQVYMGVFRPDEMNRTRWQGNLKLYQLQVDEDTNTLYLADKNGDEATSPSTGFIRNTALSFWTVNSHFWAFDPRGTPESESDSPDGEVVEKGGAHQRIRDVYGKDSNGDYTILPSNSSRALYTSTASDCSGSGCDLEVFSTSHSAVDAASLKVADSTEAQLLVDWMYGDNNVDDTNDPDYKAKDYNSKGEYAVRPSVHGDVLHSQPAVINYGDTDGDGTADVYAYYGANDGIFHALEAGKADSNGEEIWGFIPEEFFGSLKQLRNLSDPDSDGKEYFADGAVSVYKEDANGDGLIQAADGDKVQLHITMRRGGRFLYALDVTTPSNPQFLWKVDSSETGFSELGQTWSRPEVSTITYTDSDGNQVVRDVLVFGGGYDPDADDDGNARSMGRALFVLDADNGELIWQAGPDPTGANYNHTVADMTYSIPSDVTVIDRDGDDYDDRVYVGDTGGQVWRADISGHPSNWAVYKLASDGAAEGLDDRRFLYSPDVVYGEDTNGDYDAVLLGSGARTHPFRRSELNRFYMFKDRHTGKTVDSSNWSTILAADLYDATNDEDGVDETQLANADGWYIDLLNENGNAVGEKVVSSAVTLGGTTYFSTNEPPPESSTSDDCVKALGTARNYEINYDDGTSANDENEGRFSETAGGGFPPSPVPAIVEIDGKKYEVVLSGTKAAAPPGTDMGRRHPVYWNTKIDK